jgi:hypothetical protein
MNVYSIQWINIEHVMACHPQPLTEPTTQKPVIDKTYTKQFAPKE